MNTIHAHFCGGAGINIAGELFGKNPIPFKGIVNLNKKYIDTSTSNVTRLEDPKDLYCITSVNHTDKTVAGSGGERTTNIKHILNGVNEYLDNSMFLGTVVDEFHIVFFSAAGGSGSVIGPVILRALLARGISAIGVVVGDSSTMLSSINTKNTIAGLDITARDILKKCMTVVYVDNCVGISAANKKLRTILTAILLFNSGDNRDLDYRDMAMFYSPDLYTTITVVPGLYTLALNTKESVSESEGRNIMSRVLTSEDIVPDADAVVLHRKIGYVVDDEIISGMTNVFPLELFCKAEELVNVITSLTKGIAEFKNIEDMEVTKLGGSSNSDGLVI